MATLYEIDNAILECIDMETGEVIDEEKLNSLNMERSDKIEKVALWYKNLVSDAEAYKKEKDAFAERERVAKNKAESLKKWLSFALNGEKMQTPKVAISFRNSQVVEIENDKVFMNYVYNTDRDDLLTYKDPTPNKTLIKAELKMGTIIEGCALVDKKNIIIK